VKENRYFNTKYIMMFVCEGQRIDVRTMRVLLKSSF